VAPHHARRIWSVGGKTYKSGSLLAARFDAFIATMAYEFLWRQLAVSD
jgi:hypothetical protein